MHLTWVALPLAIVPVLLWLHARRQPVNLLVRRTRVATVEDDERLAFEFARLEKTRPDALPASSDQAERWFDQRPFRCC